MSTDTAVSEDVDLDVDLDEPVTCEWRPCTQEAEWAGVNTCCRFTVSFCNECKEKTVRWLEIGARLLNLAFDCKGCGETGGTTEWRRL